MLPPHLLYDLENTSLEELEAAAEILDALHPPSIHDIIKEWLQSHGYDGLYNESIDCACRISDLIPCYAVHHDDCRPGYLAPCDCGDNCEFHITPTKPRPQGASHGP